MAIYQTVGNGTGTYFSASLARDFQISKRGRVQLNGALGFNRRMDIPKNTFSDFTVNAVFTRPNDGFGRISPTVGFSKSLNDHFFVNRVYAGFVYSLHSPE
jgi:hypothetical protein